MSTTPPLSLGSFLLGTKKGRMIVLSALLGGLLLVVPLALGKKKTVVPAAEKAGASDKATSLGDLPPSPTGFGDTLTLGQKYDALISRFGGDLKSAQSDLESTRKELDSLRAALKAERASGDQEKNQLALALKELKDGAARKEASPISLSGGPPNSSATPAPPKGIRLIELASPSPKDKKDKKSVRIPTAAGGVATLLNGVFAPVTGEPSPVRLRFDQAICGPNKARIPLRDSYLIGKATGDANSCRVTIQIEKFSTVKEKGEPIEQKALGFVVADDGLEGVPGSYEWRAWEYVPLAVGAGGLQGVSGAFAQTQVTQTVNPLGGVTSAVTGDSMKLAGYQAAGGASAKFADIVAERMKEIKPAVSTPGNRRVTVVFLDGITLEGLTPEEIDYGKDIDPYRGLDITR